MRVFKIFNNLKTEDPDGNVIENSEIRVRNESPTVKDFCELFMNTLEKQEFSKEDIMLGMRDFFIRTPFKPETYKEKQNDQKPNIPNSIKV